MRSFRFFFEFSETPFTNDLFPFYLLFTSTNLYVALGLVSFYSLTKIVRTLQLNNTQMAVIILSSLPRHGDTDGCGIVGERFLLGQVVGSPIKPYVEVFWSLQPVIMSPPIIGRCLRSGLICAEDMCSSGFGNCKRTLKPRGLSYQKGGTYEAACCYLLFCVVIIR